jgi:MYXO-CTERM domain-containing protein
MLPRVVAPGTRAGDAEGGCSCRAAAPAAPPRAPWALAALGALAVARRRRRSAAR